MKLIKEIEKARYVSKNYKITGRT